MVVCVIMWYFSWSCDPLWYHVILFITTWSFAFSCDDFRLRREFNFSIFRSIHYFMNVLKSEFNFNSYKPSVLFMGPRQTVQILIRHQSSGIWLRSSPFVHRMFYQNWGKLLPNTPKIGNGLVRSIKIGKSIRLKWFKLDDLPEITHMWQKCSVQL